MQYSNSKFSFREDLALPLRGKHQFLARTAIATALALVPLAIYGQTWDGDTDSAWETGTNWSTDVAPAAGGDVLVNGAGGPNQPALTTTATVNTTAVSAGTLTLNSGGALTATNGLTLSGTGNLILSGTGALIADATLGGSGTVTVSGTGSVNGDLIVSGATVTSAGQINGTVTLSSGSYSNSGVITGATTVSGGALTLTAGTNLSDAAAVTVSSGSLTVNAADTVGSLSQSDGTLTGTATLTSAGHFSQAGGTTGGTLTINANTFAQSGGAAIAADTTVSSTGAITLDGGSIAGSLSGTGVTVQNGSTTLTGAGTFSGAMDVTNDGALTIAAGGEVSNTNGYIGTELNTIGTVTVTGTGSNWANSAFIFVGHRGNGTLTIAEGGTVSNRQGYIGTEVTGTGTATVTGPGSSWATSETFRVGGSGTGTLTVADGGTVSSASGVVGLHEGSTGTATVTGTGSIWTNSGGLTVGNSGAGTLTIAAGGAVSSASGTVGIYEGSTGTVTVTGTGSTWTNSGDLTVGLRGTGTLTIADGGSVSTTFGRIGDEVGSDGTVTVTGSGSTWTNPSALRVGVRGTGTLTVADGGSVSNSMGIIGDQADSTGTATVTGTGSTWANSGQLMIGHNGTGTLTIAAGGAVSNTGGYIGDEVTGTGTVTVTGTGSTWANSDELNIGGRYGTGTLTIEDGGAVSSLLGYVGRFEGSTGTVTVTGAGSTWTNTGDIFVGTVGAGTMTISSGGVVSNVNGYLSNAGSSINTVTVTGAGSRWTNSRSLSVGGLAGTGILTIADDGLVEVANQVTIASAAGTVGRLNIGAAAGEAAAAAGVLTAGSIAFGAGDGAIVFNHTETTYDFDEAISGAGAVNVLSGTTTLSGNSTYSGATSVSGGSLLVDGQITSAVTVGGTGTLGGIGSTGQLTVNSGGTLAPGNSIGTLTVASATFANGSTFDLEVDSAGNSDVLASPGAVTIDAGVTLDVTSETPGEDGTTYPWSTSYTFITAASVSGTFDTVTDSFAALDAFVDYTPTTAVLTLARNDIDLTVSGQTPNQSAVATALNEAGTSSAATRAVLAEGPSGAPAAMDQLSGEIHASGQTHLLQTSQLVLSAAPRPGGGGGRIGVTRGIGGASAGSAAWGSVFGSWYENREDGNAATMDGNQFGVIAGASLSRDASRTFGVMLGLTETSFDVDDRASSGSTRGAHIGLYGSTDISPLTLSYSATYAAYAIETERDVAIGGFTDRLTAEYDATALSFSAEASYDHYTHAALIQPFAGLSYTRLNVDGYTEDGGAAALTVGSATHDLTVAHLGVRFDRELSLGQRVIEANGSIGYHHVFGETAPMSNVSIGGSSGVDIAGAPLAQDSVTLGLGTAIQLGTSSELSVDYSGDFAVDARSHRASLSYEFRF